MKFKKIYIEITNVCNLNCEFCPETHRKKEFMDLAKFEEVIKKIHTYTDLVTLHVKGEPLLHNELKSIFEILNKYNLYANVTTNGILVTEKLDCLKEAKSLRQLNFSVHSMLQNKNIDIKYLDNLFNSVDKLENKIISYRFWSKSSVNDNTYDEIIKKFEEFYNINGITDGLDKIGFVKLKDNVFINEDEEFIWPNINGKEIIEEGRCLALKEQIAILVDGTVVPCCLDNEGDIPLGNIFEESLEEILNKEFTKKLRFNFENKTITCKLCKTCGFLKRLENKRKHN